MKCDKFGIQYTGTLRRAAGYIRNTHLVSRKPLVVCLDLLPWCPEQSKAKKESVSNDRSKGLAGMNHSGRVEKVIVALFYATLGKTCSLNLTSSAVDNKHRWTLKPSPLLLPGTLPFLPFVVSVWLSTPLWWNAKVNQNIQFIQKQNGRPRSPSKTEPPPLPNCQMLQSAGVSPQSGVKQTQWKTQFSLIPFSFPK